MPSVTRDGLGAWLLRCNPTRTDLAERFRTPALRWCVADNYRSRLMESGDPVLLWISGQHRRFGRGLWGRGHLTAPADWITDGLRVGLAMDLRDHPMATDAELRANGINDLEVQRMPHGSNPSWVSPEQLVRISAILDEDARLSDEDAARRVP